MPIRKVIPPGLLLPDLIMALYAPVFYLKLDDGSGTTMEDSSGNNRDGTVSGSHTLRGVDGHLQIAATGRVAIADNAAFTIPKSGSLPTTGLSVWGLFQKTAGSYVITKGGSSSNNYEWQVICGHSAGALPTSVVHSSSGGSLSEAAATGLTGFQTDRWNAIGTSFLGRHTDAQQWPSINGQTSRPTCTHTVTTGDADGPSQVQIFSRQDQGTADYVGAGAHVFGTQNILGPGDYRLLAEAAIRSGFNVLIP